MNELAMLLVVLHVAADMVWIGSILCVAALLSRPTDSPDARRAAGEQALHLYRRLASPAFAAAFTFGAARLVLDLRGYFVVTHFMHAKLALALAVVGLHHVLGARAKKRASGEAGGSVVGLAAALAALATGVVYFAIFKPF